VLPRPDPLPRPFLLPRPKTPPDDLMNPTPPATPHLLKMSSLHSAEPHAVDKSLMATLPSPSDHEQPHGDHAPPEIWAYQRLSRHHATSFYEPRRVLGASPNRAARTARKRAWPGLCHSLGTGGEAQPDVRPDLYCTPSSPALARAPARAKPRGSDEMLAKAYSAAATANDQLRMQLRRPQSQPSLQPRRSSRMDLVPIAQLARAQTSPSATRGLKSGRSASNLRPQFVNDCYYDSRWLASLYTPGPSAALGATLPPIPV